MDAGWMAAIAVVAIDVGLVFLYSSISKRQIRKTINGIWNEPVELQDTDGSIIKIPVKYEDKDGNVQTKLVVGPLWMSVAYGLGAFSVNQIKMSLLGAKGNLSRKMDGKMMEAYQKGELPAEALAEILPKKWQKYIAGYQIIREMMGARGAPSELVVQRGRSGGGAI